MKSSPSSDEPIAIVSKTPTSGKKLVQARLPFKILSGSEPPCEAPPCDEFPTAATPSDPNTPTTTKDHPNRKRKQSILADETERAAKINRRSSNDTDTVIIEANQEQNGGGESSSVKKANKNANINANISNAEEKDSKPKAKRSLNVQESQPATTRSRRSDSEHFQIKLPIPKKSKDSRKKNKKSNKSTVDDMAMDVDDDEKSGSDCEVVGTDESDEKASDKSGNVVENEDNMDGADELNESEMLDESINDSFDPSTPDNLNVTPKQLQRRAESEKKMLERKLDREERERLKKQERDEKEEQRKREKEEERKRKEREKEERELLKKKERDEKEEQRKREKEEERKKREEKEELKKREKEDERKKREEKEEQRKREKEEERKRKEEQKDEERRRKEEQKEEERRKKDEEKRIKSEFEQNKLKKTSAAFVKFFVPKKSDGNDCDKSEKSDTEPCRAFMSFQIKDDMKMAPKVRRDFTNLDKTAMDKLISSESDASQLYMNKLKSKAIIPGKSSRTWVDDEYDEKTMNSDDLFVIEEGRSVHVIEEKPNKLYRVKFLKFEENRRPPYYGTWRKKSSKLGPRRPFAQDTILLDYEVDSDDEWEEEEPGESLHGTDDESEREPEDDYDIDNDFFVPHGYLSDEEMQENEDDFDDDNDPENNKDKLKIIQDKFNDEMKKQTHKLKPRLIGLIWLNEDGSKPDNCSNGVWDLFNANAMYVNRTSIKIEPQIVEMNSDDETKNKPRRLKIGEKEVPDLIRLVNGNQRSCNFLVREFQAHINKVQQGHREYSNTSIKQKIKELAFWQQCPEKGPIFEKFCWYVPRDTCKRYGVNDATIPNTWVYTIQPRKAVECDENGEQLDNEKNKEQSNTPLDGVIEISEDSNSCGLSGTLTPQLVAQASSKPTPYNIAKFIRVLSEEEKKKQFDPITLRRDSSDQPCIVDKQSNIESPSAKPTAKTNKPKKRANLLMSVPIGQDIPQKMKTTLVTQYIANNAKIRSAANVADNNKRQDNTNVSVSEVIEID